MCDLIWKFWRFSTRYSRCWFVTETFLWLWLLRLSSGSVSTTAYPSPQAVTGRSSIHIGSTNFFVSVCMSVGPYIFLSLRFCVNFFMQLTYFLFWFNVPLKLCFFRSRCCFRVQLSWVESWLCHLYSFLLFCLFKIYVFWIVHLLLDYHLFEQTIDRWIFRSLDHLEASLFICVLNDLKRNLLWRNYVFNTEGFFLLLRLSRILYRTVNLRTLCYAIFGINANEI